MRAMAAALFLLISPSLMASAPVGPLIIIAVDGVRWQDVVGPERLALPHLQRDMQLLLGSDVAPIAVRNSSHVSLPGYREMLTGAVDTQCKTNHCAPLGVPTVLDVAAKTGWRVAAVASWDGLRSGLTARATPAFFRSAGRHDPMTPNLVEVVPAVAGRVDAADQAGPGPGHGDYRQDAATASVALDVLATLRPDVMFIGLGDTDEWAHRGDRRRYEEALRDADAFLGVLLARLHTLGAYGDEASIIVTTDHGRSDGFRDHGGSPESARIWMAARGDGVVSRLVARDVSLGDVAWTATALMDLELCGTTGVGDRVAALGVVRRSQRDTHR